MILARCRSSITPVLAVASISLVALAGCGSDDTSGEPASESSTDPSSELTKEEWIEQADAICEEADELLAPYDAKAEELGDGPETPRVIVEVADLLRESVPIAQEQIDRLRALEPPAGDEEIIDSMLDTIEERQEIAEEAADLLENGEASELQALNEESNELKQKGRGLAQGYGLKECGSEDE